MDALSAVIGALAFAVLVAALVNPLRPLDPEGSRDKARTIGEDGPSDRRARP
jgi:hypothetical protein